MKKFLLVLLTTTLVCASCADDAGLYEEFQKPEVNKPGGWDEPTEDTNYDKYTLKELGDAAGITMGVAATKSEMDKSAISAIVFEQFKSITFGNEMKNSAVMAANGTLNFTSVNQMLAEVTPNGLGLFGHVLGWHSQQRYEYLNKLVQEAKTYGEEQKAFINFETEASTISTWGNVVASTVLDNVEPANVLAGDKSLKLEVTSSENAHDTQANINIPNAEVGKTYNVCFWMKASVEGAIRVSTTDNQYLYDPTTVATTWTYYTAPVKVKELTAESTYSVRIDMGKVSATYYIDNVRVVEADETAPVESFISKDDVLGDGNFDSYNTITEANTGQGWTAYGSANVTVVNTGAHSGTNAVQIDVLTAAEGIFGTQLLWPTTVKAKKAGAHVIGMWVKALEFADKNATTGHFQLKVSTPTKGDSYLNNQPVTSEWTFIKIVLDEATYGIKADDAIAVAMQTGGTDGADTRQMRFLIDDMQIYPEGSDPTGGGSTGGGDSFLNPATILENGDFDTITDLTALKAAGWSIPNGETLCTMITDGGHSGKNAIAADNTAGTSGEYSIELVTPTVTTTAAGAHVISLWAKSIDVENRYIQLAVTVNGTTQYKAPTYGAFGGIGTDWTLISYTTETGSYGWDEITVGSEIKVAIQCGGTGADTKGYEKQSKVMIDDVQIYAASAKQSARRNFSRLSSVASFNKSAFGARAPRNVTRAATSITTTTQTKSEGADDRIGIAYKAWIFGMMKELGSKVYAWDAVNELFEDGSNKPRSNNRQLVTTGHFYWMDFMGGGEAYALKTFRYAKAIQPNAVLYINDYNLEYSTGKLDALCAFVEKHKALGLIDGVATQLHTNINQDRAAVDNMFQKLAATGLKVRVSELDIDANPDHKLTSLTPEASKKQAELYAYIVESFFTNVPAAQRDGITIWGTRDDISWINDEKGDAYPLLYDADNQKKDAYKAVYDVLLKYSGLEESTEEK